jgi:hypothetical protein
MSTDKLQKLLKVLALIVRNYLIYTVITELSGIRVTEKCLYFGVRRIFALVPQSGI